MTAPRLSDETLARVLAALPADGPGVAPVDVHKAVGKWERRTIRAGLAALLASGKAVADGPDGKRLYRRVTA